MPGSVGSFDDVIRQSLNDQRTKAQPIADKRSERVKLIQDFNISLDEVDRLTQGMTPEERFNVISRMIGQTHRGNKTVHRKEE